MSDWVFFVKGAPTLETNRQSNLKMRRETDIRWAKRASTGKIQFWEICYMAEYNKERRWMTPSKRAKSYVEERRAKVHMHGQKEGKPLSEYEAGLRSGYLQCQSDHAGLFRYKQAMDAGLTKAQAKKYSREKGTKLPKAKGGK